MITALRKVVSHALCYSGLTGMMRRLGGRNATILVYHRIMDRDEGFELDTSVISATPKNFERQMRYLAEKYHVISLEEYLDYCRRKESLPKNSVIITFDDGYKDNFLYAYPILKRYDLPATIFLAAGAIGKRELLWWDRVAYMIKKTSAKDVEVKDFGRFSLRNKKEKALAIRRICLKLKDFEEGHKRELIERLGRILGVQLPKNGISNRTLLTWEEVAEMAHNRISFGAHTLTHPILTNLPQDEAEREIAGSKEAIEDALGKKVTSFSYPNGYFHDFNDEMKAAIKGMGFECAVTYIEGKNDADSDMFELRRIPVGYHDDMCVFKNSVAGAEIIPSRIYLMMAGLAGRKRI